MKRFKHGLGIWLFVALAVVVVVSLAVANQGDKQATKSNDPVTVTVNLSDFGISSTVTTFKKGVPYHLVVTNKGQVNHEMMIMPVIDENESKENGMSMEEMDEMALGMVEEEDMPPGATQTIDVTFTKAYPEGTLEFACHIAGHYEAGMHLPIVVK